MIVRGSTLEYRRALAAVVRPEDVCVEIGSAAGVTSLQLARTAARVVGVDSSAGEVAGAVANAKREGFETSCWKQEEDGTVTAADDENHHRIVVQFVVAQVREDDCEASLAPLVAVLAEHKGQGLSDVTLLALDIAGTAPLECITPLIVSLRRLMKPRVTVVKSLTLKKLLVAVDAGEALVAG